MKQGIVFKNRMTQHKEVRDKAKSRAKHRTKNLRTYLHAHDLPSIFLFRFPSFFASHLLCSVAITYQGTGFSLGRHSHMAVLADLLPLPLFPPQLHFLPSERHLGSHWTLWARNKDEEPELSTSVESKKRKGREQRNRQDTNIACFQKNKEAGGDEQLMMKKWNSQNNNQESSVFPSSRQWSQAKRENQTMIEQEQNRQSSCHSLICSSPWIWALVVHLEISHNTSCMHHLQSVSLCVSPRAPPFR